MAADPDPVGGLIAADMGWHAVDWDHAAPGDHAKKPRIVVAEQLPADHRMDPVGADQGIARYGLAVFEPQQHLPAAPRHPDGAPGEMDRFRPPRTHRIDQHLQEVGAEDRDVGKSVALDRLGAEIEQFPGPAGIPQADLLALGIAGELTQLIQHAERVQGAGAVRADLHAGAKFLEFGRLFVNVDVIAAVDQSERSRHAADTAASDEDVMGHDGMLTLTDVGLAMWVSR